MELFDETVSSLISLRQSRKIIRREWSVLKEFTDYYGFIWSPVVTKQGLITGTIGDYAIHFCYDQRINYYECGYAYDCIICWYKDEEENRLHELKDPDGEVKHKIFAHWQDFLYPEIMSSGPSWSELEYRREKESPEYWKKFLFQCYNQDCIDDDVKVKLSRILLEYA